MSLRDIIGQDRALNILRGCIERDRVPHALLFAGDEGIGKRLAAVNFAKALNCGGGSEDDLFAAVGEENDSDQDIDACDRCPSCTKIDREAHPDVFFIAPEGDGGQITVSAIRQLEADLSYKPFEGRWKIAILDNAERLNPSAANAFLQTLEEPSPQSVFILVSSRPDMLLATIRSRCQRINFSPLPVETMSGLLSERFEGLDAERSRLLSLLSGGRPGVALNENLIDERDRSFDVLKQLISRPEDDIWSDRNAMEDWFEWGELCLRDIAVFRATGRSDLLINHDRAGEIGKIAKNTELGSVLKLARELYNIKKRLNFNLNKQLTLNYTHLTVKYMLGHSGPEDQYRS